MNFRTKKKMNKKTPQNRCAHNLYLCPPQLTESSLPIDEEEELDSLVDSSESDDMDVYKRKLSL